MQLKNIPQAFNEKEEKRNNGKNRTTKPGKRQDSERRKLQLLGKILEANTINQTEMKEKVRTDNLRRTRTLVETKPCSKNLIKRINTL